MPILKAKRTNRAH